MFGLFKKKLPPQPPTQPSVGRFPPVPDWQPSFSQPIEKITDRVGYYTDGKRDFAYFKNGTFVVLPDGLGDEQAKAHATESLHKVFHAHPDMHPMAMDDGNMLVRYSHGAANIVLEDVVAANWPEIEREHQRALATHEVLITPLGPNKFDAFGIKALFGRCYMFMDAQSPQVVGISRRAP